MQEKNHFLNKQVVVTKADGFCLYGIIIDSGLHGIWLKTDTETSFITFGNIRDIRLNTRSNKAGDNLMAEEYDDSESRIQRDIEENDIKEGVTQPEDGSKKKKSGKKENPPVQTSKIVKDGILWEQIYDPETNVSKFISWEEKNNQPVYLDYQGINGVKYVPINDDLLKKGAVVLPTGILEYTSVEELDAQTNDHIHKYLDISEEHQQKAVWYGRLSWVTDNLHTLPYLRALGDYGTGKTRYLDVIGGICYKPTYVGGAVRSAPIFRIIDKWHGTTIFDEFTLGKSNETDDIIQIFNTGFQRGKPILRCKDGDYSEVECFDAFGCKIISCRKPFDDRALESRCITETITETIRTDIPIDLGPEYFKERGELQNKLLLYRLKNWQLVKPDENEIIDFGMIQPRIKQTFLPFTVLFRYDAVALKKFIDTVNAHNTKLIEENNNSIEGSLISIYLKKMEFGFVPVTTTEMLKTLVDEHGYSSEKTTLRSVSRKLNALGFKTKNIRITEEKINKRLVIIEPNHMKKLVYRYVLPEEQEKSIEICGRIEPPVPKKAEGLDVFEEKPLPVVKQQENSEKTDTDVTDVDFSV